jgi:hypothetical protein
MSFPILNTEGAERAQDNSQRLTLRRGSRFSVWQPNYHLVFEFLTNKRFTERLQSRRRLLVLCMLRALIHVNLAIFQV